MVEDLCNNKLLNSVRELGMGKFLVFLDIYFIVADCQHA